MVYQPDFLFNNPSEVMLASFDSDKEIACYEDIIRCLKARVEQMMLPFPIEECKFLMETSLGVDFLGETTADLLEELFATEQMASLLEPIFQRCCKNEPKLKKYAKTKKHVCECTEKEMEQMEFPEYIERLAGNFATK